MSNRRFNRSGEDEMEENEANWQDSYSDLMTDLLAIFVVLFSFAMMNQAIVAYQKATASKQNNVEVYTTTDGILGGEDSVLEKDGSVILEKQESEQLDENKLAKSIDEYIQDANLSEMLSVSEENQNVIIHVASSLLFESGNAEINEEAKPVLEKLASIFVVFKDSITKIQLEGHTDNVPIHSARFASNWELSSTRAVNVVKYLDEVTEFQSELFCAVGYSEFHPIAENDTEEGREKNRRVDFVIETIKK